MTEKHLLDHDRFRIAPGTKVRLKDHDPGYTGGFKDKREAHEALLEDVSQLVAAQDVLWASRQYALIILFQALDAAGKDGTIKHVMSGVNPQGVEVHSFRAPNEEELLHHFLWRPMQKVPAQGRIAIFNRSYYEEVLVVRVHPQFLEKQTLPSRVRKMPLQDLWERRYQEINQWEAMGAHNNVRTIKFFLNVSKKEQRARFLARLEDPEKNWKFSLNDLAERAYWKDYMDAYEDMLSATSTTDSPWYVIPADKKWFTRACVADIITSRIQELNLAYPTVSEETRAKLAQAKRQLEDEPDR
jgi:PPK2 family polyphosphate:nucleotide phosphotransferase